MIRKEARKGDIITLTVPLTAEGGWSKKQYEVIQDILIEDVSEDGTVTLVASTPYIQQK